MAEAQGAEFTLIRTPLAHLRNRFGIATVYVEAASSPDTVVLQRSDLVSRLKELESDIYGLYEELPHRYPDKPNPMTLKKGRCYAIYSSRKRRWVRVRADEDVENVLEHRLVTQFRLVDYCVNEFVHPNRARFLPNSYCELPVVGYLASNTDPFEPKRIWTKPQIQLFRESILGKTMHCRPIKYHSIKQIDMVQFFWQDQYAIRRRRRHANGRLVVTEYGQVPRPLPLSLAQGNIAGAGPGNAASPNGPGNAANPNAPGNAAIPNAPGNAAIPNASGNAAIPNAPGVIDMLANAIIGVLAAASAAGVHVGHADAGPPVQFGNNSDSETDGDTDSAEDV